MGAKRIANGSYSTRPRRAQHRPQHRRKQMSVLVRIHVRHADAGRLDLAYLSARLSFNLRWVEAACQRACRKRFQAIAKASRTRISGSDAGQPNRIQNRLAIDKYQVAADVETRSFLSQPDGIVKGGATRHQRGRSHDSASMSLDNGAIDARSEAKIIGINNQTAHRVSLAGRFGETIGEVRRL